VVKRFDDADVKAAFAAYPASVKADLLRLRDLVFDVAANTEGVGPLQETLKWRQPSHLTPQSKSGSTIRLDAIARQPGRYALYFHCQSGLVDHFRPLPRALSRQVQVRGQAGATLRDWQETA